MATCSRSFTLTVSDDMPLDAATYVPSTSKIVGVRGGYLFSFNATTGAKESSARFAPAVFGNSSIVYEPVSGKIFVGCWNEWEDWVVAGTSPNKGLFKCNASTLALETHYTPPYDGQDLFGEIDGVTGLTHSSGLVWGAMICNSNADQSFFSLTPATGIFDSVSTSIGINLRGTIEIVPSGALWAYHSVFNDLTIYNTTTGAQVHAIAMGAISITGFCVAASGFIYAVDRTSAIYKVASDLSAFSTLSLGASNTGALAARYNSVDGLIYVPTPDSNCVVVFDPGSDTVSATKTGFDSPHDVVFTPTKKFAVQHGSAGLKEIT